MASRRTPGPMGTPYVRLTLAMGQAPRERVHGWVAAMVTGGPDDQSELLKQYGESLRAECAAVGFVPDFDQPIAAQSRAAQQAAARWAAAVLAEGRY